MNAATETVKRHKLTQTDCDMAKYLLEHGQTLKEIGEIIKCDPSTVGKIRLAGYDLQTYLARRKEMNRKTKERKAAEAAGARRLNELIGTEADEERDKLIYDQLVEEREAEKNGMTVEMYRFCKGLREKEEERKQPEVPGQMKMDLDAPAEEPEKSDDSKQMRFQAAMVDKLTKTMTELIVMMIDKLKVLDEIRDVLKGGGKDE